MNTSYTWKAADYASNSSVQKQWGLELIDKLQLSGNQRLLDIGCGDGKLTAIIARKFPACRIIGLDSSPDMIEHARNLFGDIPNLSFVLMDACSMEFDEPFDAAFSATALHWITDHRPFLNCLYRSLKPGARLLFQMSSHGRTDDDHYMAAARVMVSETYQEYFKNFSAPFGYFTPEEYSALLHAARYAPIRVELLSKPMQHAGKQGYIGFIRTTWMPITDRVPFEKRDEFIDAIVDEYLKDHPLDSQNMLHIPSTRLEVEAVKPA